MARAALPSRGFPVLIVAGLAALAVALGPAIATPVGATSTVSAPTGATLWAWGTNGAGQLGDGTTTDRSSPTRIGLSSDWKVVSAGNFYTAAIQTDGTLWAWGDNFIGQLGDGTTTGPDCGGTCHATPEQIGTASDWLTVSTSGADAPFTLAIKTNGTLWAWGFNGFGQLGDGTTTGPDCGGSCRATPEQIGTATDWKSVSAGGLWYYSMAIRANGSLWAWGFNYSTVPTQIGTATDWKSVSAGNFHSAAIKTDGTLWIWGNTCWNSGPGGGGMGSSARPVEVGTGTDWATVSASLAGPGTAAIKTDGTLWTWSYFNACAVEDYVDLPWPTPAQVDSATDWRAVSSGGNSTAALKTDGTLWTWASNGFGQLGNGAQVGTATDWVAVTAGTSHTVALRRSTDACTKAIGRGSTGRGDVGTVVNNLSTTLSAPQQFEFAWNNHAHHVNLVGLTSAKCGENDRKPTPGLTFQGAGTATLDGVTGYTVQFFISGNSTGSWVVTVWIKKGPTMVNTFGKTLTVSTEAIS